MTILAKTMRTLAPGIALFVVWELYIIISPKHEFYLGSPIGVMREFYDLLVEDSLLIDFVVTISEASMGFLLGSSLGTMFGLLLWLSKATYSIAKPYLIILGALPVFALGPIIIFWLGIGMISKIFIVFLATFIISIEQAYGGASQADKDLLILIKSFGGTRFDQFKNVVVPSSIFWVLAGIRLNIGMALLGAFIGEFISSNSGLGHRIIVAEGLFNVNQIWVGILGIIFIALFFYVLTKPIEIWANKFRK